MQSAAIKNPLPGHILTEAERILGDFDLCDSCLGRIYMKRLRRVSSRALGCKIKSQIRYRRSEKCYVCMNLLDNLGGYIERLRSISENTDYVSFLIGTIFKPSVMDRDDTLRSRFRLRGVDSIKSEATRLLTKSMLQKTKKRVDHLDPDLTFLVDFRTGICKQRAKSLIISGRYTKSRRGLPQRQQPCEDCRGAGCIFCNNRGIAGFNSVEGIIARHFYRQFDCLQAKFTWIGGEDRDSLVQGGGRLFFARLVNPKKRSARLKRQASLDSVSLHGVKRIRRLPNSPIKFRSRIVLQVRSAGGLTARRLAKLGRLQNGPITITDGAKSTEKRIHEVAVNKTSMNTFLLSILADGGISMKRLVEGTGIQPSVSEILGQECTCVRFDFEEIMTNDNK